MRYEFMFQNQLDIIKKNRDPLILPIGTIEYHGPHCSYGCDGLIAQGLAERLEKERELVILPTLWYGSSSYAVGGPEKGTIHVDSDVLGKMLNEMFTSLLLGGFRNIVVLIHHQYEQENYMPTTLAAASAAKSVTMKYLEDTRGYGWWGNNKSADYYGHLNTNDNPFNWIRVYPCMSKKVQDETGYDHGGKFECSILSALYPKAVKLKNVGLSEEWFIQSAKDTSDELGENMVARCIEDLMQKI